MQVSRRALMTGMGLTAAAATVGRAFAWEEALVQPFRADMQVKRSLPKAGMVILSSNENPYGALPKAAAAMSSSLPMGNRYAFRQTSELADKIATYCTCSREQVTLGNGSTEILKMSVAAFAGGPSKRLVYCWPTFEAAPGYAKSMGAQLVELPLTKSYAFDLDAMLDATKTGSGLVYICNPNNPTASITPYSDMKTFVDKVPASYAILIDEAYHHFAIGQPGYDTFLGNPRVILARTFSKVYGMAGIRLGYAVATKENIAKMNPHKLDTNINAVACAGGLSSLEDDPAMQDAAKRMVADRQEFLKQASMRKIKTVPCVANFAMIYSGQPAADLGKKFADKNILVGRPFPSMNEYLRVSFGTPAEMKQFWTAWDELVKSA
jgi:histidinol-phosphate aminotransferase